MEHCRKITLFLIFVVVCPLLFGEPNGDEAEMTTTDQTILTAVDTFVQKVRKRDDSFRLQDVTKFGTRAVPVLAQHLQDENRRVRLQVVDAIGMIGRKDGEFSDTAIVKHLVQAMGDRERVVVESATRHLLYARPAAFDESVKAQLLEMLNERASAWLCLVVGVAGIDDAAPLMEKIAESESKRLSWAAKKALARMGRRQYVDEVVARAVDEPNVHKQIRFGIPDLVYVRHPKAILALGAFLESDKMEGALGDDHRVRPLADYAAHGLGEVIEAFPIRKKFAHFTKEEMATCREWWGKNKNRFVEQEE